MKTIRILAALCVALFAWMAPPQEARAQSNNILVVATCGTQAFTAALTNMGVLTEDHTGNLCTAASVSASITGFPTVQTTGTPIAVTTGGVTGTLPAGAVVVASNPGTTNTAFCKLGASASTSDQPIPPNGGWFAFTVGANTQLTCITSTSTTTVNMVGGSGLPTGSGGGGGGSGGGGAVTVAAGADVTEGNTTDTACAADNTSGCTVESRLIRIAQNLSTLNTTAGLPANLAVNVTPTDCSGTVVTGGTAVNAFTAQTTLHGFTILNDDTSEVAWISFTTTAAASTAGSYPLAPATATSFAGASSFTSPPGFGTNHALSIVGATSAHKFSCTWW